MIGIGKKEKNESDKERKWRIKRISDRKRNWKDNGKVMGNVNGELRGKVIGKGNSKKSNSFDWLYK